MLKYNKFHNYNTCYFIAVKLATFPWNDSISKLKKNVIEFINSFGMHKYSIATLSVHVLYNAIFKKKLHEIKLDLKMIRKLKIIIIIIVNYVDPVYSI
ncbi:hypothetical protein Xish_03660 [Xenorhabdus ishibashii]|uniref:Integrase n=1 Tax=Xenorhabdus ishibashii TaxID=1034471 RepID=A0A2D0K7Y2_9GAMM|nr:hypothetical protein Xish_03660 [Xenorhabdus ishibashii]